MWLGRSQRKHFLSAIDFRGGRIKHMETNRKMLFVGGLCLACNQNGIIVLTICLAKF